MESVSSTAGKTRPGVPASSSVTAELQIENYEVFIKVAQSTMSWLNAKPVSGFSLKAHLAIKTATF